MKEHDAGRSESTAVEPETAPPASGPVDDFYGLAVRSYIATICGPEQAPGLETHALAEIARISAPAPAGSDLSEAVSRVSRQVALGWLEHEARSLGGRVGSLVRLRRLCPAVPALLRDKGESAISGGDLDRLYRHLNDCEQCAATTARFHAAEWRLALDLASHSWGTGRSESTDVTPRPSGKVSADRPEPSDDVMTRPGHRGEEAPTRAGDHPVEIPPAGRGASNGTGAWLRSHRRPAAVAAVSLVLAATAAAALSTGGSRHPSAARPPTSGPAPAVPTALPPTAPPPGALPATARQATGRRFVISGAAFVVSGAPRGPWTRFSTRVAPGPGRRWRLVDVTVTNLTRVGFDPHRLHYRLVDASGTTYFPERDRGTHPGARTPLGYLSRGQSSDTELAFRVADSATQLQLRFNPTMRHFRVEVPLGKARG